MKSATMKSNTASAASSSSSSIHPDISDAGGDVFDIDDFTCATPFEKLISLCEEHIHAWKIGCQLGQQQPQQISILNSSNPAAAIAAAAAPAPVDRSTTVSPSPSSPTSRQLVAGEPMHETIVTLAGRSFRLTLHQNSAPITASSSSSSSSTSSSSSSSTMMHLSLPLRVDHVTAHASHHHPISVFFGVSTFILLTPAHDSASSSSSSPHRRVSKNEASMLLSALSIAVNNAQCILSCFVAIDESEKQLYIGRTCYGSIVKFDSRCLDDIPTPFRHLTGLTDAFTTQRERYEGRGVQTTGNARTLVAVSYGYQQETRKWGYNDIGTNRREDDDDDAEDACRWRDVSEDALIGFGMRWGPRVDPLVTMRLTTSWPFFPEGTFVDNAVYSDLDPSQAPNWRVEVEWRKDDNDLHSRYSASHPLTSSLQLMIDICQQGCKLTSLSTVLGTSVPDTPATLAQQQGSEDQSSPLSLADAPLSSAFRAVHSTLKAHIADANHIAAHGEGVSEEYIDRVMKELLDIEHMEKSPTSHSRLSPSPSPPSAAPATYPFLPSIPIDPFSTAPYPASPADPPISAQLVPFGSLLSRFVVSLFDTVDTHQLTLRTVSTMWTELLIELRFHFETGLPIPKLLSSDTPDFAWCVLHQKLQMLQRCIRIQNNERKKKEQNKSESNKSSASSSTSASSTKASQQQDTKSHRSNWSEERLSNASASSSAAASTSAHRWNDMNDLVVPHATSSSGGASAWGDLDIDVDTTEDSEDDADSAIAESGRTPAGVESILPDTFLLLTGAPFRIPLTQEMLVMTSDKFEEQQEMFARMGTGADSSRLRTEMQTAGLASDMQAFKAANPGCILEDFVRWHSPKDWRASTASKRGELSQRMRKRVEGGKSNIWQSLWKSSRPCAASDQIPLFDPTIEGEQILNYLENIEPRSLFTQLLGISIQNCICTFARTRGISAESYIQPVVSSVQKLAHYLRNHVRGNSPDDLYDDFSQCELMCAKAHSLLLCLPEITKPTQQHQDANKTLVAREIITQLLSVGSCEVSHVGSLDRGQLTSIFTSSTPRTRSTTSSLFSATPFNYAIQTQKDDPLNSLVLPKPDWSEMTFFAPFAQPATTTVTVSQTSVSMIGSRTYVCLRHSHAPITSHGGRHAMPKLRYCSSILTQLVGETIELKAR